MLKLKSIVSIQGHSNSKGLFSTMKIKFRYILFLSLWITVGFWMKNAVNRLGMERTTFATSNDLDSFKWPLLTVCPWVNNNLLSFEDVMAEIKISKDYYRLVFQF